MGNTNAEIATHLGVSIDTIKFHIRNILVKFGVTSRKQLEFLLYGWNFDDMLPS